MWNSQADRNQRIAAIDERRRLREAEDRAAFQLAAVLVACLISFVAMYGFSFAVM